MYIMANKKRISIFLAVMLLLSGMYFELVKADSSFVYTSFDETAGAEGFSGMAPLRISQTPLVWQELCTEELLGNFGQESILSSIRNSSRETVYGEMTLPHQNSFLSEYFTSELHNAGRHVPCERYTVQVIVSYIHHQDGQKENQV